MADDKITTEQIDENETQIEEEVVEEEKQEDTEQTEESDESQDDSGDQEEQQEEKQPDPVMAQVLATLQKVQDELAQVKSGQSQKTNEDHGNETYLELGNAAKTIEKKIVAGNITGEHAGFYRQLAGLIDEINAENTKKTENAIKSYGGGFKQVIARLRDIDYRGFNRTYGNTIDRAKLDSIINDSGNPFMTYDEAMQKNVLSDPAMLRQFLASQRNAPQKKQTLTKPPVRQMNNVPSTAKFREFLIRGTDQLDMDKVLALSFDKKSDVLEAWGEWIDKKQKGK